MTLVQKEVKKITIRPNGTEKQIRPSGGGGRQPGVNTMLYYKFDGNLNDDSGNNRNGTGTGTITYGTNYADLTNGKISFPNITLPVGCTISFWFKCNGTGQRMVDMINDAQNKMVYRIQVSNNVFDTFSQFPSYQDVTLGAYDTSWHHVVAVFGTDNIRYYLDNTLKATLTKWNSSVTTGGNYIGAGRNGTGTSPGLYAGHFIIEDKARTDQEISDYYNQTKGNYGL